MGPLKICSITSEIHPFSKTGGLADVTSALACYLAKAGHDVRVFTPLYSRIDTKGREFRPIESLRNVPVRIGSTTVTFSIYASKLPASDLEILFIDCAPLYHRPELYTGGNDDAVRFSTLSRAVLESCQRMQWAPDVFHVHDWHAALTPLYLKTLYAWDRLFARSRTVLTIHNIGYQGIFPSSMLSDLGLSDSAHHFYNEDLDAGRINYLKTGILYADALTSVSPTYAREIQTPEFGAGLHDLLRARRSNLVGILNGIDDEEWNPSKDPHIPARYSLKSLAGKARSKQALAQKIGLIEAPNAPLIGIVSRLTVQKGFELMFDVLPPLLRTQDFGLAVLGSGEQKYEGFFESLQAGFRGKAAFYRGFSNELAHLIEAGSDMFLMPSLYEPCGLNQMYSLKYGTVPIVRRTGGLADTVQQFDPATGEGTGFVFDHFTPDGLRWAIERALRIYEDRAAWRTLMQNGMKVDYSWDRQGEHYVNLFAQLCGTSVAQA